MTESKTIGIKRKKNGFTQIANSLFEDSNLSWKAKGILCYLLSRPDKWKVNKTDIQRKATDGREAMQSGINELKNTGYLHIYRKHTDNGQFEYIWEYDDAPFLDHERENHTPENPHDSGESMLDSQMQETRVRESRVRKTRPLNNTVFNNTVYNNTKDKENINNNIKSSSGEIEKEFEQLWKIYPRKLGKKKAFDSYKKARKIKKIPYETIENGLYRYIRFLEQQETDEQFIQHGSTWFNGEKWQDEYVTTAVKKKPKNAMEYFRQKYEEKGEDYLEPNGNREIIDSDSKLLPELF